MTDTQNTPTPQTSIPTNRKWIMFGILFIFVIILYSTTMYRIKTVGFLGVSQDQLAHPENAKKGSGVLQNDKIKAAPATTTPTN